MTLLIPPDQAVRLLVEHIKTCVRDDAGIDIGADPMAHIRTTNEATKVVRQLLDHTAVEINLPFISASKDGPVHFKGQISRQELYLLAENDSHWSR